MNSSTGKQKPSVEHLQLSQNGREDLLYSLSSYVMLMVCTPSIRWWIYSYCGLTDYCTKSAIPSGHLEILKFNWLVGSFIHLLSPGQLHTTTVKINKDGYTESVTSLVRWVYMGKPGSHLQCNAGRRLVDDKLWGENVLLRREFLCFALNSPHTSYKGSIESALTPDTIHFIQAWNTQHSTLREHN